MKKIVEKLFLVGCSMLGVLGIIEITLRFLPVNDSEFIQEVSEKNPTFKGLPNRTIWKSMGPTFELRVQKRINNDGFFNSQDYTNEDSRALVSVVGDSYIQAYQVPDEDTYYTLLAEANKNLRVYSFGYAGAALSQYLEWARHSHAKYKNEYLIINVCSNDFDESLKKYKFAPGFHHYDQTSSGELKLVRRDYSSNKIVRFISKNFYLVRYILFNTSILKIDLNKLLHGGKIGHDLEPDRKNEEAHIKDSKEAVEQFIKDLPKYSGLSPHNVAFVIDAIRQAIYDETKDSAKEDFYFFTMRTYFIKRLKEEGYTVFDMQHHFKEHFNTHYQRFEFPNDGHWNSVGHKAITETILHSEWWKKISDSHDGGSRTLR